MAKRNDGFGIAFNDNDGGAGWFLSSTGIDDYRRYVDGMGRWRAWFFFARLMWRTLNKVHRICTSGKEPRWKRLRGWKP
jgi:hypothetical protein